MPVQSDQSEDALRAEVRAMLAKHLTPEMRRRIAETGTVFDWGLWRALAERRWIAPDWPAAEGGLDLPPAQMIALKEEFVRAHAPIDGWTITMTVANTVRAEGSPQLKSELLVPLLEGRHLFCIGLTEPDSGSDAAAAKLRAVQDDAGDWTMSGAKVFTTMAHEATHVFLLARTAPDRPKHEGLTTFVVPMTLSGIDIRPIRTLGGERTNSTHYDDVRVPDRYRMGEVNGGWDVMRTMLTFERLNFSGSVLRFYQRLLADWIAATPSPEATWKDAAVQEFFASLAIDAEIAEELGRECYWLHVAGRLTQAHASMRKLYSHEAIKRHSETLLDLIGPDALRHVGDPLHCVGGEVDHRWRMSHVITTYGGSSEVLRDIVARSELGLPRSR